MPDREPSSSPSGGGDSGAGAASSTTPPPPAPPRPPPCRACAGATFYSRSAALAGRPPTCAGLSRQLSEDAVLEAAALPPDVTPHGDFSFVCLGLASYAAAGSRPPPQAPPGSKADDDDVALPQCFGVQIIRAQAVRATPLEAGAAGGGGDGETGPPRPARPPRREPLASPPSRGVVPGSTGALPPSPLPLPSFSDALAGVPDLASKVGRSARKVADKMASNAAAGAVAARKAAESLVETLLPGGGSGRDK